MKKSILILTVIISFFALSCKKEAVVKPVTPKPTVVDTIGDIKLVSYGLDPVILTGDSMVTLTLRLRVSIAARDSDIYIPRNLFSDYSTAFDIWTRGNNAPYVVQYAQHAESGITMMATGNLRIEAGTTGVITYLAALVVHENRGDYQLQLHKIPCSVGQDDGTFESNIVAGPDCVTEWISTKL